VHRPPLRALAGLTLAALAGCGQARAPVPDMATPKSPGRAGTVRAAFPDAGLAFRAPRRWVLASATPPGVATVTSGRGVIAVWRYKRNEALPGDTVGLDRARDALTRQVRTRDPSFRRLGATIGLRAGAPAVQIVGDATIAGRPRRVRTAHVYARGHEIVVDMSAPPPDFPRIDAEVFRPLLASLTLLPARR
jgi:hypothetical protein